MQISLKVGCLVAFLALHGVWGCDSDSSGPSLVQDVVGGDTVTGSDTEAPGDATVGDVASPDATTTPDATTVTPFDPTTEASLQALLDEHVAFSADPGITLAVRTDDGRYWSGASGVRELQNGTVAQPDTGFRVGSNTKPFVAVVTLQLVDEGLLGLDDPLTDYLPQYDQWSAITVRHLLQMRSGIKDYLGVSQLMLDFIATPGEPRTPEEILAYVEEIPLEFTPGEGGRYTNSNYVLLGMIIEEVTGNQVEDEIADRIVTPLGLEDTFLDMTGETREDVARGYMDLALVGQIFGVPSSVLGFIPEENIYQGSIVDCSYLFHPSITWAAGALISSAPDMEVFVRALLEGELLTADTLAEMMETDIATLFNGPVEYGLGLQMRESVAGTLYGHGGLNFGYQAGSYYVPDHGLSFSHMHNYLPEQSGMFEAAMLELVLDGVDEPLVACLPPEDIFTEPTDGAYAHLRFKGPVNALNTPAASLVPGIANITQESADESLPLYGWSSRSKLKTAAGGGTRLDVESFAPVSEGDVGLRMFSASFDVAAFAALDESGERTFGSDNPAEALVTVADIWLDAETSAPTRLCFTAVSDITRTSRISVCDAAEFTPEGDAELRIYGSFALETDPTAVATILGQLRVPQCLCMTAMGTWGACAD